MKKTILILFFLSYNIVNLSAQSWIPAIDENWNDAGVNGLMTPNGWTSFETSSETDAKWGIVREGYTNDVLTHFLNGNLNVNNYLMYCAGQGYDIHEESGMFNYNTPYYPKHMEAFLFKQLKSDDFYGLQGTQKVRLGFNYNIPEIGGNDDFYITIEYGDIIITKTISSTPTDGWEVFLEEISIEDPSTITVLDVVFHFDSNYTGEEEGVYVGDVKFEYYGVNPSLEVSNDDITLSSLSGSNHSLSVTSNIDWSITNNIDWLSVNPIAGSGNQSVSIRTTSSNTSEASRSGTIVVSGGGIEREVTITQEGISPYLYVNPSSIILGSAENEGGSIAITSNVDWEFSESISWLNVTRPSAGGVYLDELLVSTNSANTSSSSRSGTITVSGGGIMKTIAITQQGTSTSLEISTNSITLSSSSGSDDTFTITSNTTWSVSDDASWISVSPTSDSGNKTITVEATADNTSTSNRSGTVTVSGGGITKTITVTQQGTDNGGSEDITLSEPEVTSSTTVDAGGTVDARVYQHYSGNSSSSYVPDVIVHYYLSTDCSLDDSDVKFNVESESSIHADDLYDRESETLTIPETTSSGDYYILFVADATDVINESDEDNNYACVQITVNGSNNGDFYLDTNGITIKCRNCQPGDKGVVNGITYEAVDRALLIKRRDEGADLSKVCTSMLTDMSSIFNGASSFNQPIGNWDVSNVIDMGWMFIKASAFNQPIESWDVSNVTNMSLMFTDASAFNQPIGTWDVSSVIDMKWMFLLASTFNQDLTSWCVTNIPVRPDDFAGSPLLAENEPVWGTCPSSETYLNIDELSLTLGYSSGSNDPFIITSNTSWSISDNVSWLSVSPSSGSNNGTVTITATSANTSTSNRSGTVTVSGGGITKTVSVTQSGTTPDSYLNLNATSKTLSSSSGSEASFSVSSNVSWTASNNASWLSVSPSSGNGDITITITANSANTSTSSRSATVTVSGGGITKTVLVTQSGTTPDSYLNLNATSKTISSSSGSEASFSVSSNLSWTASDNANWLSVSPTSGSNNGSVTITATSANTSTSSRSATVTVSGGGITKTVSVTQSHSTIILTSIRISGASSIDENSTASYKCTATYSDGSTKDVTSSASWSENSSYASINSSGVLTTNSVSSNKVCTITTSFAGKFHTYYVAINNIIAIVTSIKIDGITSVDENSTATYTCIATYSDGSTKDVTNSANWSDNSGYASISSSGVLTTSSVSSDKSCTITASFGEKSDTHYVTIKNTAIVISIKISGETSVDDNSTASYTCIATYSDGSTKDVTSSTNWSDNSVYASINSSGVLTTALVRSDKSCTITASYGGKSDTHSLTILNIEDNTNDWMMSNASKDNNEISLVAIRNKTEYAFVNVTWDGKSDAHISYELKTPTGFSYAEYIRFGLFKKGFHENFEYGGEPTRAIQYGYSDGSQQKRVTAIVEGGPYGYSPEENKWYKYKMDYFYGSETLVIQFVDNTENVVFEKSFENIVFEFETNERELGFFSKGMNSDYGNPSETIIFRNLQHSFSSTNTANEIYLNLNKINLYPNPTDGKVTLDIPSGITNNIQIVVLNISGSEVFRKECKASEKLWFDLSNHVSGMYFVKIKTYEKEIVRKLILDRK